MGRAPIYNGINRAGLYSAKARQGPHPGPAVMRAGNHLAVECLFFGAAIAAFVSGSAEQRIENLFSFGLIPGVGFYTGGHILGQLLVLGVELCDMIMARCFRYLVHLLNVLLSWAGTHVWNGDGLNDFTKPVPPPPAPAPKVEIPPDPERVQTQTRAPSDTDPGEVLSGWYDIKDGMVIVWDRKGGSPIGRPPYAPGDDPKVIARRVLREKRNGPSGFYGPISYRDHGVV